VPQPRDTLKPTGQSGYGVARGNLIPSKNQRGKKESDEKMKSKVPTLFAALMIALMASGFTYSMWTKTLYINGTVKTGILSASWSVNQTRANDTEWPIPEKDVSNITGTVSPDGLNLTITVQNAYPCINYTIPIDLNNTGTIPFVINNTIVGNSFSGNLTADSTVSIITDPNYPLGPFITRGTELDPPPAVNTTAYGMLFFHLGESALQNVTYTFNVNVTVIQYNEYVP
jgi:hypothetical protein